MRDRLPNHRSSNGKINRGSARFCLRTTADEAEQTGYRQQQQNATNPRAAHTPLPSLRSWTNVPLSRTGDNAALQLQRTMLDALEPSAIGAATELFEGAGWPALLEGAMRWSGDTVELSALTAAELDSAVAYLQYAPPASRHVSLHAPLALPPGGERELAARISEIASHVSAVVLHPNILAEPAVLAPLGKLVVLENMDVQKLSGRDVAELEPYFEDLPQARFCLDVAHVKSVDATMELGHELLDAFGERLGELHVSGIDAECNHIALSHADVDRYEPVLRRCRHVPWILESLPSGSASASAIQR
jgi:hypothetical protein